MIQLSSTEFFLPGRNSRDPLWCGPLGLSVLDTPTHLGRTPNRERVRERMGWCAPMPRAALPTMARTPTIQTRHHGATWPLPREHSSWTCISENS